MSVSRFIKKLGRPVAYYPSLALMLDSVNAAVFLCQLLYWSDDRAHDAEGWIYKKQQEVEAETGLTRRKQEKAREVLRGKGLLEEERRGTHGTLHFRVNMDALDTLFDQWRKAPMAESANDECTKPPSANGGKRHSLNKVTETTAETTSQTVSLSAQARDWYSRSSDPPELIARIHKLHERYCERVGFAGLLREDYLLIRNRLAEENFTDEQFLKAVDGFSADDWHRHRCLTTWKYIIGGEDYNDRIRRWIAQAERGNGNGTGGKHAPQSRNGNQKSASAGGTVSERAAYDPWAGKPEI